MKKWGAVFVTLLLLTALLSACSRNVGDVENSDVSTPVAAMVKTGLATVSSAAVAEDALTDKTVVAAVTVGDGGKIVACRLDEIETDAKLNAGKITREKDLRSKYAQGYDYGLASSSTVTKEWFEQVDALCDYVVGKTAAEVAEIPLENGVATDEALRARCDLVISDFLEAIGKACDMAADRGAQAGDTLSLSLTAADATEQSDKAVCAAVQIAAVTLNSRGVVTDCLIDETGKRIDVVDGAFVGDTGVYRSKKDQKTGADDTSDSAKDGEWAASAKAFEEYVVGKTASQVKATPLTDGKPAADTDLAEKCTVRVAEMLQNVLKAIDGANEMKQTPATATETDTTTKDGLLDKPSKAADDVVSMADDAVSRIEDALTESR